MRPQPALIPGICLALASPVLADERGDELIAAYLDQAAGKNARVTIQIKHVKGSQPPIFLAFTWMRRVQAKLTSHFIRMEAPPSEQGNSFWFTNDPTVPPTTWPIARKARSARRFVFPAPAITSTRAFESRSRS